jgi:hypothetical protein
MTSANRSREGAQIMDSLSNDPVATVLRLLFQEAKIADGPLMESYRDRGVGDDELAKIFAAEAKDYRAVYRKLAANSLNVSTDSGRFLYMSARARRAGQIVEFGTSFGISTIHLACALRDNGGGYLIETELEPTKASAPAKTLRLRVWPTWWKSALATYSKLLRMVSRKMWTWCCWTVRSVSICPCSRYWSLT